MKITIDELRELCADLREVRASDNPETQKLARIVEHLLRAWADEGEAGVLLQDLLRPYKVGVR